MGVFFRKITWPALGGYSVQVTYSYTCGSLISARDCHRLPMPPLETAPGQSFASSIYRVGGAQSRVAAFRHWKNGASSLDCGQQGGGLPRDGSPIGPVTHFSTQCALNADHQVYFIMIRQEWRAAAPDRLPAPALICFLVRQHRSNLEPPFSGRPICDSRCVTAIERLPNTLTTRCPASQGACAI